MQGKDLAALVALAALWGGSFLFMRVAAPLMGPLLLVNVRVLIAGGLLLAYAAAQRRVPAFRRYWKQYAIIALVNTAMPFTLISAAELHLTASLATILNATTPLFGALVAAIWLHERLTPARVAGLLLGLLGVAVLVGWSPLPLTPITFLSAGASLAAALCYGVATVYIKRSFTGQSSTALATGQLLGAGVLMIPLTVPAVLVSPPAAPFAPAAIISVLGLAIFCSALAYLLYFRLVERVGPTKTLSVSFLVPIWGLLWSALFLPEPTRPGTFIGLAIILASMALVTGMRVPLPAFMRGRRAAECP